MEERLNELKAAYSAFSDKNLSLNITRGKPSSDILDLSNEMLNLLSIEELKSLASTDCRNYGVLDGIEEAKELGAQMLGVGSEQVFVGGNASLALMYDIVTRAMTHGVGEKPWIKQDNIKAICLVPGYDRHFSICQHFGIEMVNVEIESEDINVDKIKELVESDDSFKMMWLIPKYNNPTGHVFSDASLKALASIQPKARDFRIICDNAYSVHDWVENPKQQVNFLKACKEAGNEDLAFLIGSTSKVTFAGSGLSFLAASKNNYEWFKSHSFFQTIGNDKVNMLRHVKFLKDLGGIKAHMKKHAAILKPKFDLALNILEKNLSGKDIARWTSPEGGYFISLDVKPGTAKRVEELADKAGLKLTKAGATYPYKKDPADKNLRIAPSFPPIGELEQAMELLCVCVELAALE